MIIKYYNNSKLKYILNICIIGDYLLNFQDIKSFYFFKLFF